MTAAPPRTTADLSPADQLSLESWMTLWPLLSEGEARQELGLPAAPSRHLRNPNASTPQPSERMAFCQGF